MSDLPMPLNPAVWKVRRVARIGTVASVGIILAWFVGELLGEGASNIQDLTRRDLLLLLCFPLGVVIGMVVGWWQEVWGGLITAVSLTTQYAGFYLFDGRLPSVWWVFLLFAAPGLLFLVAAFLAHRGRRAAA